MIRPRNHSPIGRSCISQTVLATWSGLMFVGLGPILASDTSEALLRRATTAYRSGDVAEARQLADQAIASDPEDYRSFYVRGRFHADKNEHRQAIRDFDAALKLKAAEGSIYHHRGVEYFKLGDMEKSIADFDRYLEMAPEQEPHHWQRGIAYYYAGRYEDGQKQFELHQTVNRQDVENAVWHFLCIARQSGVERARAQLIPIRGDSRVPMKEVHELFAGNGSVDDVLAAAGKGSASDAVKRQHQFYAHLYLGLYFEALGEDKKAQDHILLAAELSEDQNYMGAVARVHAARLKPLPAQ